MSVGQYDLTSGVQHPESSSGHSSASLRCRFLAEGILPTTNEISVLKFAQEGEVTEEKTTDGFFVRHLPAELLREVSAHQ